MYYPVFISGQRSQSLEIGIWTKAEVGVPWWQSQGRMQATSRS